MKPAEKIFGIFGAALALAAGLPLCAMAFTPPPAFAQAQKKYDAGDYAGAAAAFSQLSAQEPENSADLYNLGDSLFKEGRLGPAIAAYQKAFDLDPRDSNIRYNLNFALKKAGETLVPPGVPPVLFDVFYWFSLPELSGLQWTLCWLALILCGFWILLPGARDKLKPLAACSLALWIFWGGWFLVRKSLEPERLGVIISPSAEIRSGPGDGFNVIFTAPEGRRVEILAPQGDWLEIGVLKEGVQGWIKSDAVEGV
ncbi:MAG TPA: tetratricopeptide repeat protein [Elusimicrobiota bacterium]|nr:tetratricopeptide repeat protein [Elusimicrobiota bacterium]